MPLRALDADLAILGGTLITPAETIPRGTVGMRAGRILYCGPAGGWMGRAAHLSPAASASYAPGRMNAALGTP